jgi:hypothetical protein
MKNVHVLPTEKYSELVHSTNKYGGLFLSRHYSPMKEMGDSYQYIYITSYEEIKDGDWCLDLDTPKVFKLGNWHTNRANKIILTTDQELIANGVEAIDDDFLDWFVKNPSCEFVGIKKYHGLKTSIAEIHSVSGDNRYDWKGVGDFRDYTIIIPQEEAKKCNFCNGEGRVTSLELNTEKIPDGVVNLDKYGKIANCPDCTEEPYRLEYDSGEGIVGTEMEATDKSKQETLEDAAERNCESITHPYCEREKSMFIAGAKWQAERMYSEEEVEKIISKLMDEVHSRDICYGNKIIDFKISPKKWFEKNKK